MTLTPYAFPIASHDQFNGRNLAARQSLSQSSGQAAAGLKVKERNSIDPAKASLELVLWDPMKFFRLHGLAQF